MVKHLTHRIRKESWCTSSKKIFLGRTRLGYENAFHYPFLEILRDKIGASKKS